MTNLQHTLNMGGEMCIPATLLTRKHDLTVEDLSTGSNWQSEPPWMKLGIEDMPISPYQSLTITREVEELIDEEELFKDMSPLPEPLILETDIPGSGTGVNASIFLGTMPPPTPPPPQCRAGWELIS